jgi:hypothetical protein
MAPPVNQTRFARAGGEYLWSATYHVALQDTAGAEKQLAEIERALEYRPFQYSPGMGSAIRVPGWDKRGRSLAISPLSGEGPEEAARMYRRVIGLWAVVIPI